MRITHYSWENQTEFGNYIQQASFTFSPRTDILWNLLPYLLYSQQQKRDFLLQKHVSNTVWGRPNEFDNPKSRVVRRTFWLMKVVPTWKKFEKRWTTLYQPLLSFQDTFKNVLLSFLFTSFKLPQSEIAYLKFHLSGSVCFSDDVYLSLYLFQNFHRCHLPVRPLCIYVSSTKVISSRLYSSSAQVICSARGGQESVLTITLEFSS